ncbi:MAG: hypothetical protein MUP16_08925 [Sedimentisphaerales bacterium]|nr:hypothetical protein [Sedimentisphaerales bacterium]
MVLLNFLWLLVWAEPAVARKIRPMAVPSTSSLLRPKQWGYAGQAGQAGLTAALGIKFVMAEIVSFEF